MSQRLKRICPKCGCRLIVRSVTLENNDEKMRILRSVTCGGDREKDIPPCNYSHSEEVVKTISDRIMSCSIQDYFDS